MCDEKLPIKKYGECEFNRYPSNGVPVEYANRKQRLIELGVLNPDGSMKALDASIIKDVLANQDKPGAVS